MIYIISKINFEIIYIKIVHQYDTFYKDRHLRYKQAVSSPTCKYSGTSFSTLFLSNKLMYLPNFYKNRNILIKNFDKSYELSITFRKVTIE